MAGLLGRLGRFLERLDGQEPYNPNSQKAKKRETRTEIFDINRQGTFDIEAQGHVTIVAGNGNKVTVEVKDYADDLKNFTIEKRGDDIIVHQPQSSAYVNNCAGVYIDNCTGISNSTFGDVSGSIITGNSVYINGKRAYPNNNGEIKIDHIPAEITITAPAGWNIKAGISGVGSIVSKVPHNDGYLRISGTAHGEVTVNKLNMKCSSSSDVEAKINGGALKVDLSGSSEARIEGSFSEVAAALSGTSKLKTKGPVSGGYDAQTGGASKIVHKGSISGRVRQQTSGASKIQFG